MERPILQQQANASHARTSPYADTPAVQRRGRAPRLSEVPYAAATGGRLRPVEVDSGTAKEGHGQGNDGGAGYDNGPGRGATQTSAGNCIDRKQRPKS